jgi:peptidyl-prolyl cis-trans isomerase B (cyclophilin B)
VSPKSREREYARRRYEQWQSKQAVKLEKRRKQRRAAILAGSAAAVVLVLAVSALLLKGGSKDDATTASATPSTSASAGSSPAASVSASASATAGPNPCPVPTVKPPATPQQFSTAPDAALAQGKSWKLTITTSCGPVVAVLDGAKAPKAVANAIFLSEKKFWNGSPCHRLGADGLFMLQCGDPTGTGSGGPGYQFGPVENPPSGGIYPAGSIALARSQSESSQGSQFFLVFKDTQLSGNYTIFGKITSGLDVITKVAAGGVATPGQDGSGPPVRAISIVTTAVSPA